MTRSNPINYKHDNHELLCARIGITASSATAQSQVNRITTGTSKVNVSRLAETKTILCSQGCVKMCFGASLVLHVHCSAAIVADFSYEIHYIFLQWGGAKPLIYYKR